MKPAIITFAAASTPLAETIAAHLDGELFACGSAGHDAKILLPRLFSEQRHIIGICAAGILIRLLAPAISDKQSEPPVLAVSHDGASVVPLLGRHHRVR